MFIFTLTSTKHDSRLVQKMFLIFQNNCKVDVFVIAHWILAAKNADLLYTVFDYHMVKYTTYTT